MTAPGEKLEVGQEVWLYYSYRTREPTRQMITKVGRTLVTLDVYGREKYHIDTGYGNVDPSSMHFKTDARRALDERLDEIRVVLREHGLQFTAHRTPPLSLAQLEAIVQIVQQPIEESG